MGGSESLEGSQRVYEHFLGTVGVAAFVSLFAVAGASFFYCLAFFA